ncbi:hypothetical protein HNQ51_000972 [Inhella inkyongensis]|uniref:DUF4124 domain-containing protein n=1 Tax=Inhella inkyongensis TaxID=392593 RepID=A0A840S5B2_9BURK|nr:hypothetical protein [Inhella inkyongensis]MBB5203679.1 hypothetical protein [Inhella inkyongensis]
MKPLFALLLLSGAAQAQSVVYRCPGPPVLYTDAMSAKEAQEKGCKSIEGAPVSVLQGPRPKAAAAAAERRPEAARADPGRDKVDPDLQKARDSDRRKVLESELRDAEAKLDALKREYNGGEPERRGDERNFAKYQERVNELKAAITRQEADLQALRREISKL